MNGRFIISLDFELHWGGAEKWDLKDKKKYFLEGRKAVVKMLELFNEYEIHATWATVGFLFAKDKEQLLKFLPQNKPSYQKKELSTYEYFDQVGTNEKEDPFHFAGSLIEKITSTPGQELATHTFSHYYCNEPGQDMIQFEADLQATQKIARKNFNIQLKSIVFPRNQYNPEYLKIVKQAGIEVVRSNPNVWFWQNNFGKITPLLRAADTLIPISKSLAFNENSMITNDEVLEIPASRFFRPYKTKEKFIQNFKMKRIKNEMTYAAKNKRNYHLWWHPHNFGNNPKKNIKQLEEIIIHYKGLNQKYGFSSVNMLEIKNQ